MAIKNSFAQVERNLLSRNFGGTIAGVADPYVTGYHFIFFPRLPPELPDYADIADNNKIGNIYILLNSYNSIMDEIKIGVVGYSAQKFDEAEAERMLKEAYNIINSQYAGKSKAVVSGLTDLGIPALAYREAVSRGDQKTTRSRS